MCCLTVREPSTIREHEPGDAGYGDFRWASGEGAAQRRAAEPRPEPARLPRRAAPRASVTRAAAGLGLSQPTLSTALSRLRRHFDDELLTRVGNSYELTPLATTSSSASPAPSGVLERVFAGQPEFDPAVSDREFTVVVSDYAATVLGGPLSELLAEEAPSVCLRFQQMRTETVDAAPESLRAVDGLLLPHGFLTDLPHQDLYDDEWVCMVGAGNEVVGDTFTLEHLHTLPMAVTYREPTRFTPAVKQLHMLGIEPRVVAVSESFLALPFLVAGTDRFALVQQRLAARLPPPRTSGSCRARSR